MMYCPMMTLTLYDMFTHGNPVTHYDTGIRDDTVIYVILTWDGTMTYHDAAMCHSLRFIVNTSLTQ